MFKFYQDWRERRRQRKFAHEAAQIELEAYRAKVAARYEARKAVLSSGTSNSPTVVANEGPSLAFSTDGSLAMNMGGIGIDSHGDIGIAVGPLMVPLTHHEEHHAEAPAPSFSGFSGGESGGGGGGAVYAESPSQPSYDPPASSDSGSSSYDSSSSSSDYSGGGSWDSGSSGSFDSGSSGGGGFDSGSGF